jgi:hypothetical protein
MLLDRFFFFSALGGGALFVIQLILLFLGGSADVDLDLDTDLSSGDVGHAGADASFKVLSLQGITTFVMMFGLVGMAMRNDEQAGPGLSLAVAAAAGAASTWVIGRIFVFFNRLQSTGTLDMKSAVGATGQVYLSVGPNRPGKVNITVGQRLLTLEAITEKDELLETGTPIKVIRVISDTTVSVERN